MTLLTPTHRNNPVRDDDAAKLVSTHGIQINPTDTHDYRQLLAAIHKTASTLMNQHDYQPAPHFEKYPRQNIHLPDQVDSG
jgi:amidase